MKVIARISLGRHPSVHEPGDPAGEDPSLSRARPGDDDERPVLHRHRLSLAGVEVGEQLLLPVGVVLGLLVLSEVRVEIDAPERGDVRSRGRLQRRPAGLLVALVGVAVEGVLVLERLLGDRRAVGEGVGGLRGEEALLAHSHSIVPGGLEVMS